MDPRALIEFLGVLERLKGNARHSWTSDGMPETVAAHSWRLAVIALLLRNEFPALDMDRVLAMCIVHDFGEAVTGDIPSFLKTDADETHEDSAVDGLIARLPARRDYLAALFAEMRALATPEARLWRALDKLEAVLQHNEADIDTWLPLEYDLQQTYGVDEAAEFPFLASLRAEILADSLRKIEDAQ